MKISYYISDEEVIRLDDGQEVDVPDNVLKTWRDIMTQFDNVQKEMSDKLIHHK